MDERLLKELSKITEEEQAYLNGEKEVQKERYTNKESFVAEAGLLLEEHRLISVRAHTRFVDFPMHSHNYVEIMYVVTGTITHIIDGEEILLNAGDMLFLNQYTAHEIKKSGKEDVAINFLALPEFFDVPLNMMSDNNVIADFLVSVLRSKHSDSHYLVFHIGDDPVVENLMESMIFTIKDENVNSDLMNQYYMGIIFLFLVGHPDSLSGVSSKSYKDIVTEATLRYINTRYRIASLSKVCADFNLSESALSKIIKSKTGKTFQEHLMEKRFSKAKELLEQTKISIEEVAYYVGYENYSFFYRQFKERFGITPREYRLLSNQ